MGYVFFLSGLPICWCSKNQGVITLSTCEAEYIFACNVACQALWMSYLLEELSVKLRSTIELLVDNKSTIDLAKNPVSHGRSRHIETKYYFLREQFNKGKIELRYCKTKLQFADIMT